ncbi:hypothetical protein [Streptomyces sp. YS-3]|uniref:hypothetical protein n=1 Tax=Streptomyces sp. YS-3 TaxID=3381352 RepID=UPI00386223B1
MLVEHLPGHPLMELPEDLGTVLDGRQLVQVVRDDHGVLAVRRERLGGQPEDIGGGQAEDPAAPVGQQRHRARPLTGGVEQYLQPQQSPQALAVGVLQPGVPAVHPGVEAVRGERAQHRTAEDELPSPEVTAVQGADGSRARGALQHEPLALPRRQPDRVPRVGQQGVLPVCQGQVARHQGVEHQQIAVGPLLEAAFVPHQQLGRLGVPVLALVRGHQLAHHVRRAGVAAQHRAQGGYGDEGQAALDAGVAEVVQGAVVVGAGRHRSGGPVEVVEAGRPCGTPDHERHLVRGQVLTGAPQQPYGTGQVLRVEALPGREEFGGLRTAVLA